MSGGARGSWICGAVVGQPCGVYNLGSSVSPTHVAPVPKALGQGVGECVNRAWPCGVRLALQSAGQATP